MRYWIVARKDEFHIECDWKLVRASSQKAAQKGLYESNGWGSPVPLNKLFAKYPDGLRFKDTALWTELDDLARG